MKTTRPVLFILILMAGAFVTGWFLRPCHCPEPEITTRVDTLHGDPYPVKEYYPVPVPVYSDTGTTRWKAFPVDTGAILADYFSRNAYYRILKDDSSAFVAITDTVTQNRLTSFIFEFQNRRPTAITYNTYQAAPAYQGILYLGASALSTPERGYAMAGAAWMDSRQRVFFLHADLKGEAVMGGTFLPLWRKKSK